MFRRGKFVCVLDRRSFEFNEEEERAFKFNFLAFGFFDFCSASICPESAPIPKEEPLRPAAPPPAAVPAASKLSATASGAVAPHKKPPAASLFDDSADEDSDDDLFAPKSQSKSDLKAKPTSEKAAPENVPAVSRRSELEGE